MTDKEAFDAWQKRVGYCSNHHMTDLREEAWNAALAYARQRQGDEIDRLRAEVARRAETLQAERDYVASLHEQKIEDLARGAFEEAMSFGVNFDVFHRMAKAVASAEREACAALGGAGKITPTREEGTVVVDWDCSEEAAAAIRARSNARLTGAEPAGGASELKR